MGIADWSTIAIDNATAGLPGINWREGQSPGSVNNSARAMMAEIAEYRDGLPASVSMFGAVAGASAAANTTALNAANASADYEALYVPQGRFDTTYETPFALMTKRYYGDGQIILDGFAQARDRSFFFTDPGDPSDNRYEIFDGLSPKVQRMSYVYVDDAVGQATSGGYRNNPGVAQAVDIVDYLGGHNTEVDDNDGGRSGWVKELTRIYHGGQGDCGARGFYGQAYSVLPDVEHFLASPALFVENGNFDSVVEGAYFQHSEYVYTDGNHSVAVIDRVRNYYRSQADDTLGQVWLHDRPQSVGVEPMDGCYAPAGDYHRLFDAAAADLGSDQAALTLKTGQRTYYGGSVTADAHGHIWKMTTLGEEFIEAVSGVMRYNAEFAHRFNTPVFTVDQGTFKWESRSALASPSDGVIRTYNNAQSAYARFDSLLRMQPGTPPATAGAAGAAGDVSWASGFLYVCVATDTWQRVAIATW